MSKKNSKVGLIKLTKTMLDKCIIDANKTVVDFALQLGIDYAKMECGEKILVDAVIDISFFLKDIHKDTVINFYRVNNSRGDKRISIKDIKHYASVGNLLRSEIKRGKVIVGVYDESTI